jgi:hypothetical protein
MDCEHMAVSKNCNDKTLGRMVILNALKLEETLAGLLRTEARLLRKQITKASDHEEIININKVIKYLLFSISMIDDRIRTGIELMEKDSEKMNDNQLR